VRKVTLVRGARQLLTLRGPSGPRRGADLGNLGIIQDGAVLIADGLIVEVGPSRRVENLALARGAREIDASGCVALPGFVDSHVEMVRGATQHLSPRALKTLALRVVDEAVRHGATAMEVKSGELKTLRMYATLRELPLTLVPTFAAAGLPLQSCERLLPLLGRRKLAEFIEIGCDDGATLAKARQLGWGIQVRNAITAGVRMGALCVNDVVDATERDAMLLGRSETIAVLSPAIGLESEARFAPARMLIDNGAAVALASGSGADSPNMQITIGVACRAMNMTAAEAISASTINGAHAMRRAGSIGSIEAGKSADLSVLGVPDYRELPYHFGVNLVNLVMIRGTVLVERSEVKWPAH
jgi:imidazolonepropionase